MHEPEGGYTSAETAQMLNISERTLRNWRDRGLIVAVVDHQGLNPTYRYTAEAIAECRMRVNELRAQQA